LPEARGVLDAVADVLVEDFQRDAFHEARSMSTTPKNPFASAIESTTSERLHSDDGVEGRRRTISKIRGVHRPGQ
jgi:hypothetical protein